MPMSPLDLKPWSNSLSKHLLSALYFQNTALRTKKNKKQYFDLNTFKILLVTMVRYYVVIFYLLILLTFIVIL